jgi:hypothetical protein
MQVLLVIIFRPSFDAPTTVVECMLNNIVILTEKKILPPLIINAASFVTNHKYHCNNDAASTTLEGYKTPSAEKRVSFCDDVSVCPIEHINECSQEEVTAQWYNDNDYRRMKKRRDAAVKLIERGCGSRQENPIICLFPRIDKCEVGDA